MGVFVNSADVFCGKSFAVSKRRRTDDERPFEFNLFDCLCGLATVCFTVFAMLSRVDRQPDACWDRGMGVLVRECLLDCSGEALIAEEIDWKVVDECAEDADANVSGKLEAEIDGTMDSLLAQRAQQSNHTRQALAWLLRQPLA